ITRFVFLEIALDFSHEIGPDVSGFRVNTAPKPGEYADQTRPERHSDKAPDFMSRNPFARHVIKNADGEKREADDEQTGHGAAVERDLERGRARGHGSLGYARI